MDKEYTEVDIELDQKHIDFLNHKNIDISEFTRVFLDKLIAEKQLKEAQEKLDALFK